MPTLVFDCETIPDVSAYAQVLDLPPTLSATELAMAWEVAGRPFKPTLQRVVALAVAWIDDAGTLQRLGCLDPDEATMVRQFFEMVARHHPVLVGWNSRGFDLPVLCTRAMVHRLAIGEFYGHHLPYDGYLKRFSDRDHRDLMDWQSHFRATTPLQLQEMAALLGIPGKLGMDGSQVLEAWQAGQTGQIAAYCEHDVMTTAWVYARMAGSRGWWTEEQLRRFEASARSFLLARKGTHWQSWSKALDVPGSA